MANIKRIVSFIFIFEDKEAQAFILYYVFFYTDAIFSTTALDVIL